MSSYRARLDDFARDRRLFRLRDRVMNRDTVTCDACGSLEPRVLHILKEEALGRYFFVGSNCLHALAQLRVVRKRYVSDSAEDAYEQELARRQGDAEGPESLAARQVDGGSSLAPAGPRSDSVTPPGLVAAVAVLHPGEWADLLRGRSPEPGRWRLISMSDPVQLAEFLAAGPGHSGSTTHITPE